MIQTQSLIGTILGTCVLEKLVAQAEMGAVFWARQLNSQERVVVKILLPPVSSASQTPSSRAVFLERFRQEMTGIAALAHQHILPVYTFGEHQGLAYLVMPYVGGGTLAAILQQEGQLAMPRLLSYLQQLAAALDYAHERDVVHYHLEPGNVLLTPEGNVLVAEFGQINLLAAKPTLQMRLLGIATPATALEYMAPEQLMGDVVDARTDLYSLGVIVYRMVTGKTPFQGAAPMQMAAMLVQASPPSPRSLRADLPVAAEQVLLHALAKRSQDRYASAQDFVNAFRASLSIAGASSPPPTITLHHKPRSAGLLSAMNWRAPQGEPPLPADEQERTATTMTLPQTPTQLASQPSMRSRLGAKTSLLRLLDEAQTGSGVSRTLSAPPGELGMSTPHALAAAKRAVPGPQTPLPSSATTGALPLPNSEQGSDGTVRLTGTMKVVQVPVAGQPGRYVTGLLPVLPATAAQRDEEAPAPTDKSGASMFCGRQKIVALILLLAIVLSSSGLLWFFHSRSATPAKDGVQVEHLTPDLQAIMAARATATATANTILADPLIANIHNWPVAANGSKVYTFAHDGYHITDNDPHQSAPAILPDLVLRGPVVFSLTMREIKGNDSSMNNSFGLILRLNTTPAGNNDIVRFYCFEVVNNSVGNYQFVKYDSSSKGPSPWMPIWQRAFGGEFHQGHGPTHTNIFKVVARGTYFTFFVNGKKVGNASDGSLASGEIGMLVNLQGTEVAFSNLLLTYS